MPMLGPPADPYPGPPSSAESVKRRRDFMRHENAIPAQGGTPALWIVYHGARQARLHLWEVRA